MHETWGQSMHVPAALHTLRCYRSIVLLLALLITVCSDHGTCSAALS
jgi:hypothetical protein